MTNETKTAKKSGVGILTAIGILLLSKLKWVIGLLKFSKFGATFISMIVSLWAYAVLFGWKFAIAIVYLIFIHEMGHLLFAKIKGLKTSPAIFLPFMGAVIAHKRPEDVKTEAFVAYGGPLFGLLSFLPFIPLYMQTGDPLWAMFIYLGAFINLFNLMPVSPLDGGRIIAVLSTKAWFFGILLIIGYVFFTGSPIALLILLFGIFSLWGRMREDYQVQLLSAQNDVNHEMIDRISTLKREAFQQVIDDENRTYFTESGLRIYLGVEIDRDIKALEEQFQLKKRFYWPFFQDNEKVAQEIRRYKIERLRQLLHYIKSDQIAYEDFIELSRQLSHEITENEKHQESLRTYYVTDKKTKWTYFFLYIALVGVLSYLSYYGIQISETELQK